MHVPFSLSRIMMSGLLLLLLQQQQQFFGRGTYCLLKHRFRLLNFSVTFCASNCGCTSLSI
jgi:hypothetical protein